MALGWTRRTEASASLIAAHDWLQSPLGARDGWPPGLAVAARLCEEATVPLAVWWGPSLIQVYDAAFRDAVLDGDGVGALGVGVAEAWPELWPDLRTPVALALGGEGVRVHGWPRPQSAGRPLAGRPLLAGLTLVPLAASGGQPPPGLLAVADPVAADKPAPSGAAPREEGGQRLLAELQAEAAAWRARAGQSLGLARALLRVSAEASDDAADLAMELDGRLDALLRAQAVATRDARGEVDLDYLVAEELAAHGAHENGMIRIDGPPIRLASPAAQIVGLAVRELAAHALARNVLPVPSLPIRIDWRVASDGTGSSLALSWTEEGAGPGLDRAALGVLEAFLTGEADGRLEVDRRAGGFACRITLPFRAGIHAS